MQDIESFTQSDSQVSVVTESSQGSDWFKEQMSSKEIFNKAMQDLTGKKYVPLRSQVSLEWDNLQKSSRSYYLSKAHEAMQWILSFIAPHQEESVMKDIIKYFQPSHQSGESDMLLDTIIESYRKSNHSSTQIQILSLICNNYTKEELKKIIPGLTTAKIDKARRHAGFNGPGNVLTSQPIHRDRLTKPKVSHFLEFISSPSYCQIVGFGSKLIKMSNGVEVKIPKVVRSVISSRIVELYSEYCNVNSFDKLSRATLFKILKICAASKKTSLRGLDNTIADGMKAIEVLEKIVRKCNSFGLSATVMKEITSKIQQVNIHMKFDIKGHIELESCVALHCSSFALSDKTDKDFRHRCNHEHDKNCEICLEASNITETVMIAYNGVKEQIPNEIREEMEHEISSAGKLLCEWQSHCLRTVHQDKAKQCVLENLKENEVLIIMDWAMKFIPFLHREKQTEFFGKKGISWHFSCAVTRESIEEDLQLHCYIHILQDGLQDWFSVACILDDTIQNLKKTFPRLNSAYLKSDNAGCYHNTNLLAFIQSRNTNKSDILIMQYNFSEAQSGKDLCDSKTSHSKLHMLRYADEGHDIATPADMKVALDSYGGLRGTCISVVSVNHDIKQSQKVKISGISYLNNFEFQEQGIYARKAYQVGQGKEVKNSALNLQQFTELRNFEVIIPFESTSINAQKPGIVNLKKQLENMQMPEEIETDTSQSLSREVPIDPNSTDGTVSQQEEECIGFPCIESGCIKEFLTAKGLENHIVIGKHVYSNQPATDTVKEMWIDKCHDLNSKFLPHSYNSLIDSDHVVVEEGWGLKKPKKAVRFSPDVKEFLYQIFEEGERSGKRPSYEDICDQLKKERTIDGEKRFTPRDWLSSSQIRSLFASFTCKANRTVKIVHAEVIDDPVLNQVISDMNSIEQQEQLEMLSNEIIASF